MKVDFSCPIVQTLLAVLIVGFITLVSLLKLYIYLTTGYYRKLNNMEGKTVIVTGANAGIGKQTALEIAKRGARVILACRNLETAAKTRDEIIESTNNRSVVVKKLDLSSQKSIREFADEVVKTEPRLDVLLHNAGTAEQKIQMTEDKLERTWATNYYGPFLLTHLLIDLLKKSAPSRIVIVASDLYKLTSLDLNKINPTSSWFPPMIYYPTKYADICFSNELARRLEGTGVTANCLHPGLIDTGIWDSAPAIFRWPMKICIISVFFKTPQQGCQTSVYLACSDEVQGVTGKYFAECREKQLNSGARDADKAKKLWELSENFVNLRDTDPKI